MGVNPALQALRRPQIIEAALRTIAELGFQNLTLELVARRAGMSKGGLVHYFPTKQELIQAAVSEFYDTIFERGRRNRDRYQDPMDKVLSFTWLYDWDDPDVPLGYRLLFDFMALASQEESFRRDFHNWVEGWIELLQESIQEGMDQGLFQVPDAEEAARTVSAIYQGIATRWSLAPDTHSSRWAIRSLRRAVSLLLTGGRDRG